MAFYPLNGRVQGRDLGPKSHTDAQVMYLSTSVGPYGQSDGSYIMDGDFMEIVNGDNLDTRLSTSILLWVYHEGQAGPIVHYGDVERTVKIWLTPEGAFSVVFANRDKDAAPSKAVITPAVPARTWHHVAAVYDHVSGVASVWLNGTLEFREKIGQKELATDSRSVYVGAVTFEAPAFLGRVSCLQFYDLALPKQGVSAGMEWCKGVSGELYRADWRSPGLR